VLLVEALTAEEVGQLVTFIAPGFFARLIYTGRFPRREPQEFALLISSVVFSLPLVALTNAVAPLLGIDDTNVTDLPYVLLLLTLAMLAGYLAATVRGWPRARELLARIGLVYQPESSIYAQTLLALPEDAVVTVEFNDGRKLSGTPRLGPGLATEDIAELYLTHPSWWDPTRAEWVESGAGGGVIVPLENVHSVTLDRDST
jgi:Family of unknown function (DUF6338)